MVAIPKNNLKERMTKLGYNPNLAKITPPVLDNSNIIKQAKNELKEPAQTKFEAPLINIDDWSDFEEE